MNIEQMTQKTREALQAAQRIAVEYSNNAVEQEHLLAALAQQQDGLIPQLLQTLGIDANAFAQAALQKVEVLPRVTGSGRDPEKIYISNDLDRALNAAEQQAKQMKDEYISVEHVFLGILQRPGKAASEIFKTFGITTEKFMKQLSAVRGNQRVTSDNPEDTYNALKKYGQDLVEMAKAHKLDPVIGRDTEIRNVIRILSRKRKNNPVLIGEAGVGKTAIAEGIAHRIVDGDVPETGLVYSMAIREVGGSMYDSYLKTYAGVDPNTGKSLWYVDPDNGDYSTTDVYDNARQARQGSTLAKVSGGFATSLSFYGVDISAQFAYQLGGKLYDNTYHELMHYGDNLGMNFHKDALKAWTPENPNTNVPRLNSSDDSNQKYSSRFLVSSDYLSVNNVTVGYTLPKKWSNKIGLGSIRIYFSGDNLAVFSAREGLDPRIVFGGTGTADNTSYSALRTISGGINLTF